jgi:spore coat polysaccharide biosynthesis protein SpsF
MLAILGGRPLLEWVLIRASRSSLVNEVVLATTENSRDDALVDLARKLNISVFRGSEGDVLERFSGAARKFKADTVVRVCADNPFIDPDEIDRLIKYYNEHECDYACNHQARLTSRYADGFGAEIFSNDILQQIALNAKQASHREHATLFLWEHPERYLIHAVESPSELAYPELRFDVDSPSDLDSLNEFIKCGVSITSAASDIVEIARAKTQCKTLSK